MKSKQLANVLIKIIGLYVCLCVIPSLVSGILIASEYPLVAKSTEGIDGIIRIVSYSIGDAVQAVVGIFLIVKSRKLAEYGSRMKRNNLEKLGLKRDGLVFFFPRLVNSPL
jgi:hypothetical protein